MSVGGGDDYCGLLLSSVPYCC